jgi:hypothetical protein
MLHLEHVEFLLALAGLETARAKMIPADLDVAKTAQKPAAIVARQDRFLVGVIETGRLTVDDGGLRSGRAELPRESGKNPELERGRTSPTKVKCVVA